MAVTFIGSLGWYFCCLQRKEQQCSRCEICQDLWSPVMKEEDSNRDDTILKEMTIIYGWILRPYAQKEKTNHSL